MAINSQPNRYMLMRALIYSCQQTVGANQDPSPALGSLIQGKFNSEITDGKTLIRTMEAGGDTQFALMGDLTPADIVDLAMQALSWVAQQPDPTNIGLPRYIKRVKATFNHATI